MSAAEQLDIFDLLDQPDTLTKAVTNYAQKHRLFTEGHLYSGLTHITTPEDLVHVVAPFRKLSAESMYVIVTDKLNKIIGCFEHTRGGVDSSSVHPSKMILDIIQLEGAANFYCSHNHPSSLTEPSTADINVTKRIVQTAEAHGLHFLGHAIVGNSTSAFFIGKELDGRAIAIVPKARRNRIPIYIKRRFGPSPKNPLLLTDPGKVIAKFAPLIMAGKFGVAILDVHHNLSADWLLPFDPKELRPNKLHTDLLKTISNANGGAAVIIGGDRASAHNTAAFLKNIADFRLLDWLYEDSGKIVSAAALDQLPGFRDIPNFYKIAKRCRLGYMTNSTQIIHASDLVRFKQNPIPTPNRLQQGFLRPTALHQRNKPLFHVNGQLVNPGIYQPLFQAAIEGKSSLDLYQSMLTGDEAYLTRVRNSGVVLTSEQESFNQRITVEKSLAVILERSIVKLAPLSKVYFHRDESEYLDLNAPLKGQEHILSAFNVNSHHEKLFEQWASKYKTLTQPGSRDESPDWISLAYLYSKQTSDNKSFLLHSLNGNDLYRALVNRLGSQQRANSYLNSNGIAGTVVTNAVTNNKSYITFNSNDIGHTPLDSVGITPLKSLSVNDIENVLNLHARPLPITPIVIKNESELPHGIFWPLMQQGYTDEHRALAIASVEAIYLIADNIPSANDAIRAYVHECYGHHAIAGFLGAELNSTLDSVAAIMPLDVTKELTDRYAKRLAGLESDEASRMLAAEYIALLAEDEPENNFLAEVIAVIAQVLRKIFPTIPWTQPEVITLIANGRSWLNEQDPKNREIEPAQTVKMELA